jgi:cytochrome c oxidase subunit 3
MAENETHLAEQFDDMIQQEEADMLGMWTFLATEVLFFGGLFIGYIVYRTSYPTSFIEGGRHSNLLLGTINTVILLTSSLTMVLAVHAAQEGRRKDIIRFLLATIFLGLGFLLVKGIEYHQHISEHLWPGTGFSKSLSPQAEMFFNFYWVMTGLHALHVIIGIGAISILAWLARRQKFSPEYYTPVEICGLYWHFVDIVWVFLYPMFYLVK